MTPPFKGYMGSTFKIFSATEYFNYELLLKIFLFHKDKYKNSKVGAAIPHLNKVLFKESLIALPPFEEQQRIVDKINSIEPMIQEYDKYEKQLSELESTFSEKLKKSILQYAIEGKLVKQDPNDEPASVLLERIKAEKEKLIKEGKIKRDKNESYIYQGDDKNYYEKIDEKFVLCDEIVGFSVPSNWAFSHISQISSYGFTCLNRITQKGDWLLELEDIKSGSQKLITIKYTNDKTNLNSKVSFNEGMILYSKLRPYLDKVLIANNNGVATSEIVPFWSFINNEYLVMFYRTPYFLNKVTNLMYGVKMPRLGTDDMRNTIIPIPPLNEQNRIVNRIRNINLIID